MALSLLLLHPVLLALPLIMLVTSLQLVLSLVLPATLNHPVTSLNLALVLSLPVLVVSRLMATPLLLVPIPSPLVPVLYHYGGTLLLPGQNLYPRLKSGVSTLNSGADRCYHWQFSWRNWCYNPLFNSWCYRSCYLQWWCNCCYRSSIHCLRTINLYS